MRSVTFILGFALLLGGIVLGLWYAGFLAAIGPTWTLVALLVIAGLGIMAAATRTPRAPTYYT
jgi:hypothetical protein